MFLYFYYDTIDNIKVIIYILVKYESPSQRIVFC